MRRCLAGRSLTDHPRELARQRINTIWKKLNFLLAKQEALWHQNQPLKIITSNWKKTNKLIIRHKTLLINCKVENNGQRNLLIHYTAYFWQSAVFYFTLFLLIQTDCTGLCCHFCYWQEVNAREEKKKKVFENKLLVLMTDWSFDLH